MPFKISAGAAALAFTLLTAPVRAQTPAPTAAPAPTSAPAAPSFGSHQIDRFEAIRLLQQSTTANPKAAPDWVILGELSHEAALDLPTGQDVPYYKISRDAYEHAAALAPDNAGLKAAVQFARDQEAGAAQFDASRKASARAYIASRRRELTTSGLNPTVRVYAQPPAPDRELPTSGQPTTRTGGAVAARPNAYPTNQPYNSSQGQPYTYQQFRQSYLSGAIRQATGQPSGGGGAAGGALDRGAEVKPAAATAPPG